MNIHEYQAKALLRSYGAPVSDGRVVLKAEDAKSHEFAGQSPVEIYPCFQRLGSLLTPSERNGLYTDEDNPRSVED